MSTKIKLILLTLLFSGVVAFGQTKLSNDFKVNTGKPYKVVDALIKEYLADSNSNVVSVKTFEMKVIVQRFDKAGGQELSRKEYNLPEGAKVQKVARAGNRFFYIYYMANRSKKNETVYAREVNMKEGLLAEPRELFTTGAAVSVCYYVEGSTDPEHLLKVKYDVLPSFDGSQFLINYRTKPVNTRDAVSHDVLGFYVFNDKLEKQWGGEAEMPYTEAEMNNLAYTVGKNGTAYMLAFINQSKTFELLSVGRDLKVQPHKIDINGNLHFQEFELRESLDGNLSCTGFYANGIEPIVSVANMASFGNTARIATNRRTGISSVRTSFNTNGILHFKMKTDGALIEKLDYAFPIELINQNESKRAQLKNDKKEEDGKAGINDIRMTDIINNKDGSMIIVGEQQFVRNDVSNVYKTELVFSHEDVVITKIDKNGKLEWMKKLPKKQTSHIGKGSNGICFIQGKNEYYVMYMDNRKNAELSDSEAPSKYKDGSDGFLTTYKIDDKSGNVVKHLVLDTDNINGIEAYQFTPSRIFKVADQTFFLEIYIKGKEDSMVSMELKK